MDLETRGIPCVGVATTEFVDAAATQAQSLGYPASLVFVPHPVQDRTDEELRQIADAVYDSIMASLMMA